MRVDAISLEVFKNRFIGVAELMGVTLQRASFSPNIRERLDFSCALFDAAGRMVAQAAHIPVHLGSMPASVEAALTAFEDIHHGDVVLLNDPYHGGSHLPDLTMVSPVFTGEDRPTFYVASRAHHADIGGMSPGSLPLSTELYQEGLVIPPVKLRLSGWLNDDVLAILLANSRAPSERRGDLEAQLAAHRVGEARLMELVIEEGIEAVQAHASALQDYTREMIAAEIAAIPDGTYSFEDRLEGDGQTEDDLIIRAALTVAGNQLAVDFSGTAPQSAGNVNAVPPIVRSAVAYCVCLLSQEDIPVNAGIFDPLQVHIPAGSLLHPRFPAAVASGNTETSQRIVDVVLGALAQALPERIPAASQGTMNNLTVGGTVDGQPFVYYETIGGGHGAALHGPGLSGRQVHMTNTRNTPVEALEMSIPLRVWQYRLREASGGAGQHRGGDGIVREFEFLVPMTVTLNAERRRHAPYGVAHGSPGVVGRGTLIQLDGTEEILPGKFTRRVQPGERLRIETPGGGGAGQAEA